MSNARVVDAVNFLIEASNFASLSGEMTRIIENWDMHPMSYGGHLSPLNAMLDVGLHSREAFERLLTLVEDKRRDLPAAKRGDYQRNLMRERRARMAKAMELHERRYGLLRGAARMTETQAIQTRWAAAKRQFMAGKGALDWSSRNDATREFWEMVDRQLDANLKSAHRLSVVA